MICFLGMKSLRQIKIFEVVAFHVTFEVRCSGEISVVYNKNTYLEIAK